MADQSRFEKSTFRLEQGRAVASGVLETASLTFLLLIAVRVHHLDSTAKGLVAAGTSFGFLLSPLVVTWVEHAGWRTARVAMAASALGMGGFLLAAACPAPWLYVPVCVASMACWSAVVPLQTQIYQDNYPQERRGRLFSRTVMLRIATAVVFSEVAGRLLGNDLGFSRWLLLIFAGAFGVSAWCFSRMPSRPLTRTGEIDPFRAMRYVVNDAVFRRTLICWMLMGFANLMMLPLRVEYLANPKHGLGLTVPEVAMLAGVIPNAARLFMSPVWGWLFDRMNFFLLRAVLNAGFAVGILAFFASQDVWGLLLGAVVFGISNAGGDVAWGLWVTKISPPDRVADYMSAHTFFTGLRGVVAPLVAFHASGVFSLSSLSWVASIMIVLASLLLIPEIRSNGSGRGRRAEAEPTGVDG
ncbi:MAG: MFS transporter [Verrucomicrobia bacterium]|nr:MFS transporter [Verrucomicrobiota bacterium]